MEQLVENVRVERFEQIEVRGDRLVVAQVYRPSLVFVRMENVFDAGQPGNIEEVCPDEVRTWNSGLQIQITTDKYSFHNSTSIINSRDN